MAARVLWDTEIQRDYEEELIFRARQYVNAISFYQRKKNIPPNDLDILYKEKFLRKKFEDPFSDTKKWDIVMKPGAGGSEILWVVPEELVSKYIGQAKIVGVISTSPLEGYREYRKKRRYHEWAFYVGADESKDMPELKIISQE